MTVCQHCSATWAGLAVAHCSECHRSFSTVANFDKHRARKYSGGNGEPRVILREYGQCYDPADDGMVLNEREHWSMPNNGVYDFTSRVGAA